MSPSVRRRPLIFRPSRVRRQQAKKKTTQRPKSRSLTHAAIDERAAFVPSTGTRPTHAWKTIVNSTDFQAADFKVEFVMYKLHGR